MKKTLGLFIGIILSLTTFNAEAASDMSQAKNLCENATEQQRQMARAAGYDVDSMCSSLQQQKSGSSSDQKSGSTVLPRELDGFPVQKEQQIEDNKKKREQEKLPKVERELDKFGYDLFSGIPTTYTPVNNIPVPANYIIGPGDIIKVQLYGKENKSYELTVERDGAVQFPELGPINVAGLSYSELKESLAQRISEQYIGVQSNISLGELRSIQVFVLGESFKPGAYTVSSLSTVMNVLHASGGLTDIGSLRNIQLKRNGQLISTIDLYDLLLKGDTSDDKKLRSGDVIYIPSSREMVSVAGEVARPAIYEVKDEQTVSELIELAGGLLPTAYKSDIRIERISDSGQQTVVDMDFTSDVGRRTKIQNGDVVKIYPAVERKENVVELTGHVYRPGLFKWTEGLKLTDIIKSEIHLKPHANIDAVLILREKNSLGNIYPIKVSLRDLWNSRTDFMLEARDEIIVLNNMISQERVEEYYEEKRQEKLESMSKDLEIAELQRAIDGENTGFIQEATVLDKIKEKKRAEWLEKEMGEDEKAQAELLELKQIKLDLRNEEVIRLIEKLKQQSTNDEPSLVVKVSGAIKFPGEYPLTKQMTPKDLIQLAGGLSESAYTVDAELTRQNYKSDGSININHLKVDLQREFLGDKGMELTPFDELNVKITPDFREEVYVEVQGEVKFPGRYKIARGETLKNLLGRVGGFSQFAHPKATVFSRKALREHEQKKLDELQARIRQDIAVSELEDANIGKSADVGTAQSLLDVLDTAKATGRLVVDIDSILNNKSQDIILKDGDKLVVPSFRQEITVVGEVQVATSHLYNPNFDFEDYIERSGGEKDTANEDAIYIVKADGSVVLPNESSWLTHRGAEIEPGDTVVVPLDTSRVDNLELWTKVTQIVYQLALGAAAVNSF